MVTVNYAVKQATKSRFCHNSDNFHMHRLYGVINSNDAIARVLLNAHLNLKTTFMATLHIHITVLLIINKTQYQYHAAKGSS